MAGISAVSKRFERDPNVVDFLSFRRRRLVNLYETNLVC